jgi:hypothetical protein
MSCDNSTTKFLLFGVLRQTKPTSALWHVLGGNVERLGGGGTRNAYIISVGRNFGKRGLWSSAPDYSHSTPVNVSSLSKSSFRRPRKRWKVNIKMIIILTIVKCSNYIICETCIKLQDLRRSNFIPIILCSLFNDAFQ